MKTNFDKILQTNRIIKLTQQKAVRLHDQNDVDGLKRLIVLINSIMRLKNELDPTRIGEKYNKTLTMEILLKNIEHVRSRLGVK